MDAATRCPKCGAGMAPLERFCGKCGFQAKASEADARDIGARVGLKHEKQTHQQRIKSGRTTILVVAILMTLGSVAIYVINSGEVQKGRREIEAARGNELYDQGKVAEADAENRKASRLITLLATVNFMLALCYFGLWVWAKTKPLPATLAALILFITVIAASAAIDPKELVRGFIVKILVIAFLVKAVDSAKKYQKMQEHGI